FTWTSVPFAKKYYLYVGTTVGAKDVIDSQEICDQPGCNGGPLATSWNGLNGGKSVGMGQITQATLLYARLWTMDGDNVWRYVDSTFTTAALVPIILNPQDGSTKEAVHEVIKWTVVPNATAYRVTLQLLCDPSHSCTDAEKT